MIEQRQALIAEERFRQAKEAEAGKQAAVKEQIKVPRCALQVIKILSLDCVFVFPPTLKIQLYYFMTPGAPRGGREKAQCGEGSKRAKGPVGKVAIPGNRLIHMSRDSPRSAAVWTSPLRLRRFHALILILSSTTITKNRFEFDTNTKPHLRKLLTIH